MKLQLRPCTAIIEVSGITTGSIQNRVEFQVPKHFVSLDGVYFSATDTGAVNPKIEIFGPVAKGFTLGNLSLHINNRKSNPIVMDVRINPSATVLRKREFLSLKGAELEANTLIQGYYVDLGFANRYPYTLKIYLRGKAHVMERANHDINFGSHPNITPSREQEIVV